VRNPGALSSWFSRIARYVCVERRRAARRRTEHETKAVAGETQRRANVSTPGNIAERADLLDRLTAALDALTDKQRLAIHLYYLDPNPVGAASNVLGLSRSAYYKLLAKARSRLATLMRLGDSA